MATQAALARTPRARSKRPWPETWVAAAFVAPAALVIPVIKGVKNGTSGQLLPKVDRHLA